MKPQVIWLRVFFACVFVFVSLTPIMSNSVSESQTRIIPLPEAKNPSKIRVEKGRIYIIDEYDLIIYDLSSGRMLGKSGKRGQGPGEFTYIPESINVFPNRLVVGDMQKVLFFSPEGAFIDQMRMPGLMRYAFLPAGSNYVGYPVLRHDDGSSTAIGCIYDSSLKLIKKFYEEMPTFPAPPPSRRAAGIAAGRNVLTIRDYADFLVYDDKIYVADSRKGLFISVFDERGDRLYEISHKIPGIKVPKNYRDGSGRIYDDVTRTIFPAFINFRIDAERIYVITPDQKEGLYKVIVMDLKGKILEEAYRFPLRPNFSVPHLTAPLYDIEDDKFIWYSYDDAKGIYEIHIR